jgi:hypothetical protein
MMKTLDHRHRVILQMKETNQMPKNDNKYDGKNGSNPRTPPTDADLLGFSVYTGQDFTRNVKYPPQGVPPRPKLPGRGDPDETLDRFSPGVQDNNYDAEFALDDDSDLATPEEITDPVVEANSQRNLVDDCPSTLDPTRFANQNRAGKRG